MAEIRHTRPDDWRAYKALRLEALGDSPDAFGGSLEQSLAQPDSFWQERVEKHWWVAEDEGRLIGMAGWFVPDDEETPILIGMYVAPEARGQGLGQRLVAAVCEDAGGHGHRLLKLGVTEGNPARRLYERCGFRETGESFPLRPDTPLVCRTMSRELLSL